MMNVRCCRCAASASSLMGYNYAARRMWLIDVEAPPPQGLYALCETHANQLTPPQGWVNMDRRKLAPVLPFGRA